MQLSFGPWTLDAERRQLLRDGADVRLSPKAFDLLTLLAGHARAFSKGELHEHLWPNTFVSDGSLTILIAEIRDVLGDDAQRPQYVRTVQRFGYAFCATVTAQRSPSPGRSTAKHGWLVWGERCAALVEPQTILGRASDAAIRFDLPGVSRHHARISVVGEQVTLEDLASRNGTYRGAEKISGPVTLSDGDEIRLGPVRIRFRLVSPESSTSPM
jgi:DNA-binding winged helix-turn-helix (wHTH) protein